MSDIAIKVENLSKRYRIGLKDEMPDTFIGEIKSWLKAPLTSFKKLQKLTKFEEKEAKSREQRAESENIDNQIQSQNSNLSAPNPMPHAPCCHPRMT